MKIAVVGNGNPKMDYSELIDGCDTVVRINLCNHYDTGKVGRRTDVLFSRSAQEPYILRHWHHRYHPDIISDVTKIVFIVYTNHEKDIDPFMKKYPEFLDKELLTIGESFMRVSGRKLKKVPTAGFFCLQWLLESFSETDLFLFGFYWEFKARCHDADEEKEFIEGLGVNIVL